MPKAQVKKYGKNSSNSAFNWAKSAGRLAWRNRKTIAKTFKKWRDYRNRASPHQYKKKKPVSIISATGMTNSRHMIKYKSSKNARLHKMIGNVSTFQVLDTNGFTSNIREQGVNSITTMGIGGGITTIGVNGPQLIELFNIAQLSSSNAPLTGQTYSYTGVHQSFKFFLQSVTQQIVITNQSQCDVNVDLYLCMSKNTMEAGNLPSTDWTNGINDQRAGANSGPNSFFPGSKPFESKNFNMAWKVVKKLNVCMGSGATHTHQQAIVLNRIIDMSYADQNTFIKGISFVWMMVQKGQIVSDATNNNINFAPTELITAVTTTWKTRLCQATSANIRQVDNQENVLTTARFVDKVSGAVEDLLVAAAVQPGGPS